MYNLQYTAAAAVLLLFGSACAREESSASGVMPQQAQDAAVKLDAGAERDEPSSSLERSQAGARSQRADAGAPDAEAESPTEEPASAGGSGAESKPARSAAGGAGAGGSVGRRPDAAGQPSAGRASAGRAAEAGGGGAGSRAEAGEGGGGEGGEGDGGTGSREPTTDCERIVAACEAVSAPDDDVTSCLELGQASDESACGAGIDDCRRSCGAPLCQQVLEACPETGTDAVFACRQLGVTNNAGDCFGDGAKCITFCDDVEEMQ